VNDHRPALRFAPSPTGELHLGHALSALTGQLWAERLGARFLLRIEDIDTGRSREHFIEQIFEDLAWLRITWHEPALRQSDRFDIYRAATYKLRELGLLYPCFATRSEINAAAARLPGHPTDPDGAPIYPGLSKWMPDDEVTRRKAAGEPFALRIDMQRAVTVAHETTGEAAITYTALAPDGAPRQLIAHPERWGDAVIVRKEVPTSYHLAVVVDDACQGITHVTRGLDLEAATDLHRLLQILLGLPAPKYHHHRLLLEQNGRKFSKSDNAVSLRALRENGATWDDILEMIGPIVGPTIGLMVQPD
jgi:glutamyl-Q tRNA(Asp) synthetase